MNNVLLAWVLIFPLLGISQQDTVRKVKTPIWTFQHENTKIYGISIGLASYPKNPKNSESNGLKIELLGLGFFLLLAPESPLAKNDSAYINHLNSSRSENIRGIALSGTGSICDCNISGITIGGVGQYYVNINGIGIAPIMFTEQQNGLQLAIWNNTYYSRGFQGAFLTNVNQIGRNLMIAGINFSEDLKGVQIGLFNKTSKLKGIQIGLWNINNKRKLPLINWNFKD